LYTLVKEKSELIYFDCFFFSVTRKKYEIVANRTRKRVQRNNVEFGYEVSKTNQELFLLELELGFFSNNLT
jgi:hypothetical protein